MEYDDNFEICFKNTFLLYEKNKDKLLELETQNENEVYTGLLDEVRKQFTFDYYDNIEKGIYFFGCPLNVYKTTYTKRKEKFLVDFIDANEIDFLDYQLRHFDIEDNEEILPYPEIIIERQIAKNLTYSIIKTIIFLYDKVDELGYKQDRNGFYNKKELTKTLYNTLKWHGDKSNLIEVIEALIVNNNIKGTKKDIYETFGRLFNEDLSGHAITVNKFGTIRNNGNETKFLNELKTSLLNDIALKLEKKRR